MSKCSLFLKTKKGELDSTILAWIKLNSNFLEMDKIVGPKFSIASTKNKEFFRHKLSISFQFWDTKYFVIKTFDLTLKTFSVHLHSFPGSLHIRFLVKRRSREQSFSLWY